MVRNEGHVALARKWGKQYSLETCVTLAVLSRNVKLAECFYQIAGRRARILWDGMYNITKHTLVHASQR